MDDRIPKQHTAAEASTRTPPKPPPGSRLSTSAFECFSGEASGCCFFRGLGPEIPAFLLFGGWDRPQSAGQHGLESWQARVVLPHGRRQTSSEFLVTSAACDLRRCRDFRNGLRPATPHLSPSFRNSKAEPLSRDLSECTTAFATSACSSSLMLRERHLHCCFADVWRLPK